MSLSSVLRRPVRGSRHRWCWLSVVLIATLATTSCDEDDAPPDVPEAPRYRATIRRTAYGVPHITANDLGSVGFGQGYAFAQDHACILADQILKVRGERARVLGPGPDNAHVASDFAYRVLDLRGRAEAAFSQQPSDVRMLVQGFADGYNQYLEDTGAAELPCAGQPWVRAISAEDLSAYHLSLGLLTSSYQLINAIAAAQPPAVSKRAPGAEPLKLPAPELPRALEVLRGSFGSNGWAIGAERSLSGHGMLLANPHFPWEGELRLWESHLTVPGQLNVYGATLMGVPGVLIGFNDHVAWTHTVSAGTRFTVYSLQLVPGRPTHYFLDGTERAMEARDITIQVKQPDGSLQDVTRTFYRSHFGPIIVLPNAAWGEQSAFSYRDANLDNDRLIAQYLGMNQARSLAEFQQVFTTWQGIPWVNTMAADREGNVWYTDASATPNLSPTTLQRWGQELQDPASPAAAFLRAASIVLLDGSTTANDWVNEPGSRQPGLIPFARLPQLERRDFVFNANNSHWLANPEALLEGYSPLLGGERQPLMVRTRMNARMLTEVSVDGASGADGKFTLEEVQAASLNNRSLTAELLRSEVVEHCTGQTSISVNGQLVDIRQACAVLAAWNGRFDTDSVGAALWREFIGAYGESSLMDAGPLFAIPFSPNAPLTTPNTLVPAPESGMDPVLVNLGQAVLTLGGAGIPVDRPLGQVQFTLRGERRIPISGGTNLDGVTNVVTYSNLKSSVEAPMPRGPVLNPATELSSDGYVINIGTSFLLAMEFTEAGIRGMALLTYGQSEDPDSPHFIDQTEFYSRKEWRKVLFTEEEIRADPTLQEQVIESH